MYAVHHVADDHGDEHRADVSGEGEAGERREPYADLIADADGQQKKHEALDKARAVGDEALVLAGNVGRKGSRRGGAAGGHRSGTQIVLFDETLGRRAAHQRTGHETERCRRDGNDAAADHARGFKVGAERRRRARAADQSDGAAADTEQRIAPEERHHAAAKEVLQRDPMEMARHRMTALLPLSNAGILTVKPTVVKNMIIKTVCSVASKLMDAMPME